MALFGASRANSEKYAPPITPGTAKVTESVVERAGKELIKVDLRFAKVYFLQSASAGTEE